MEQTKITHLAGFMICSAMQEEDDRFCSTSSSLSVASYLTCLCRKLWFRFADRTTSGISHCFFGQQLLWCIFRKYLVWNNLYYILSHGSAFYNPKNIQYWTNWVLLCVPMGYILDTPSGKFKTLLVDTVEKLELPTYDPEWWCTSAELGFNAGLSLF